MRNSKGIFTWLLVFCLVSASEARSKMGNSTFDIEGHRGARGLYPENTVTAFIEALKLGVTTLEMDIVVSADNRLVVSHDPWMNDAFCSKPDGTPVEKETKEKYNLYKMSYAEIAKFDCGKRGNSNFPLQKAIPEHKPLLSEVITKVEDYIKQHHLKPVHYNIETKSEEGLDGTFNPAPAAFIQLLYSELKKQNILQRCIIQSFDIRTLQALQKINPKIKTALLVENTNGVKANLDALGFTPSIYSPDFHLVNKEMTDYLHQHHIQLIPWTVNETSDIERMIESGVDGIISDYPNRVIDIIKSKNK